jgi:hypothetical protein
MFWSLKKKHNLGQNINSPISDIDTPPDKKLRPNQEARIKCREIAKELWKKHHIVSKEMAGRPEIVEVGRDWTLECRRRWICDLAPDELKKGGRPKEK